MHTYMHNGIYVCMCQDWERERERKRDREIIERELLYWSVKWITKSKLQNGVEPI